MKKSRILIAVLIIICIIVIFIDILLNIELNKLKTKGNDNKGKDIFYICELDAGNDVFKYKYREDIYFDKDGTLTLQKSGTSRIVKTQDEIDILIKESKMFNYEYELLGEREIHLYNYLEVNVNGTETWYKDVITGLKSNGYKCRSAIIENKEDKKDK